MAPCAVRRMPSLPLSMCVNLLRKIRLEWIFGINCEHSVLECCFFDFFIDCC
jgi:hypothetical protein